jgi:hypothetical protein
MLHFFAHRYSIFNLKYWMFIIITIYLNSIFLTTLKYFELIFWVGENLCQYRGMRIMQLWDHLLSYLINDANQRCFASWILIQEWCPSCIDLGIVLPLGSSVCALFWSMMQFRDNLRSFPFLYDHCWNYEKFWDHFLSYMISDAI